MAQSVAIIRGPEQAAAVTNPLRARVLDALKEPGSATSVAEALGITRQKVNYHIRTLERHGLVEHVEDRKRRNFTERIVRATARHYLIAPSVLGKLQASPEDSKDRLSSAYLAAVSARTVSDVAELRERARESGKKLATFTLETAIRFPTPEAQTAFTQELTDAITDLVLRHHDGAAPGGRWFRFIVGSHPALASPTAPDADSAQGARDV